MSGTYQEINLDAIGNEDKQPDLVLVEDQPDEQPEIVVEDEPVAPTPPVAKADADDDDDGDEAEAEGQATQRRPLTRTQRLKAARDQWRDRAQSSEQELAAVKERLAKLEGDAVEGAAVSMDLYIRSLDDQMKSLRVEFDKAFDSGDRDALFKVNQQIAEIQAEKKAAERERRTIPTKAAPASGSEGSQPTRQTTDTTPRPSSPNSGSPPQQGRPSPEALAWHQDNQWFGKDQIMTVVAATIDKQMVEDGFDAREPGYFDELDRRLREAMPDKFRSGGAVTAKPKPVASPTIQSRGPAQPAAGAGKITVRVTQADRQMAASLGLDIKDYMAAKVRREQFADKNPSGYTEIV